MSTRQFLAVLGYSWAVAARAESPQDAIRKSMQASVARQRASVTAMRLAAARQRTVAVPWPATGQPASDWSSDGFFTISLPPVGNCDPLPEEQIRPLISEAAKKEGLAEELLRAVAEQESGLRACAVSNKGAMGLMQLMPATAQELGVHDPFDPAESMLSGARYLKQLLDRFHGDPAMALGAYNAGPARVEESGGVPEIPETARYVRQILGRLWLP